MTGWKQINSIAAANQRSTILFIFIDVWENYCICTPRFAESYSAVCAAVLLLLCVVSS